MIIAGETGGINDSIAVVAKEDIHGGCIVVSGISKNLNVTGEIQHSIATCRNSSFRRLVTSDRAAVHIKRACFHRTFFCFCARHIDRTTVLDSDVAGHIDIGYSESLCLIVNRASLVSLISSKSRVFNSDHGTCFRINRTAPAVFDLFTAVLGHRLSVCLVTGELAVGDSDTICPKSPCITCLSDITDDGAAVHGKSRFGALINAATVLFCGIAGNGDIGAVDRDTGSAIDRATTSGVILTFHTVSLVASQLRRTV